MIGTITPLVQGAHGRIRWFSTLVAYTLGSTLAGAVVGTLFGLLGGLLNVPLHLGIVILASYATLLMLGELGLIRLPSFRFYRQTRKEWFYAYGPLAAAFLWGLDLGTGLTTVRVFASFWLLPAAAFLLAEPLSGALIMGSYGLGRALMVATGIVLPKGAETTGFLQALARRETDWHRFHATAMALGAALLLLTL